MATGDHHQDITMEQEHEHEQQERDDELSSLSLEQVRVAATELGYEEWYHSDRYNPVVAFCKAFPSDNKDYLAKLQIYLETRAMNVCIFENSNKDHNKKYDDLFSTSKKTLYLVQDVNNMDEITQVLTSPLEYSQERGLGFVRCDNTQDEWTPVVKKPPPPPKPTAADFSSCANCGKTPSSDNNNNNNNVKLHACSRCKSVAYCNQSCQRQHWKHHKLQCREYNSVTTECDAARRWHHVAIMTGLMPNTKEDLQAMMMIQCCQLLDYLLFEPKGPPCLCRGRYGCGAPCALSNLLLEVGREHHDVIGFCPVRDAMARYRRGSRNNNNLDDDDDDDSIDIDIVGYFPACANHDAFMDEFEQDMAQLQSQLVALPTELRAELINWQFERIRCDAQITMIDSNEMPLVSDRTFPLHFANMDYSRLVYGDEAEKYMCFMHGTFYPMHDDDDEGEGEEGSYDDGEDEGTEATASTDEEDKDGEQDDNDDNGHDD